MESVIKGFIGLLSSAADFLFPLMAITFIFGVVLRALVYYTVQRQDWFTKHFDKKARDFLDQRNFKTHGSFFVTIKKILEKSYYELFIFRSVNKRRNPDVVMDMSDRIFLIQHGSAHFVKETLRTVKYWTYGEKDPRFKEATLNILRKNPCFNKVFGIFPVGGVTDILNLLPGIFLVGGIFGTFLGIMAALPELQTMDLADIEASQRVMGRFLDSISFSMSTSIMGIMLSVCMSVLNTVLNPEKLFLNVVNRYERSLEMLWDACDDNLLPENIAEFDEHQDSLEILASEAVEKETNEHIKRVDWSKPEEHGKLEKTLKSYAKSVRKTNALQEGKITSLEDSVEEPQDDDSANNKSEKAS